MNFEPIFEIPYSTKGIMSNAINSTDNDLSITRILEKNHIKYILLRKDLTIKWLSDLDKEQAIVFKILFSNGAILFRSNGYLLLDISPDTSENS